MLCSFAYTSNGCDKYIFEVECENLKVSVYGLIATYWIHTYGLSYPNIHYYGVLHQSSIVSEQELSFVSEQRTYISLQTLN